MSDVTEELIEESKSGFDLKKRLQKRGLREATVTVYTDEVTGERLGDDRVDEQKNGFGVIVKKSLIRTGIIGALADLDDALNDGKESAENARKRKALEAERAGVLELLESTALVVKLRAVHPIAVKAADRAARKAAGLKGGQIPEDKAIEYLEHQESHLLADMIVSITDKSDGAQMTKVTVEDTGDLRDLLPASEYRRLIDTVGKLQYQDAVAEAVTRDADFSQAG